MGPGPVGCLRQNISYDLISLYIVVYAFYPLALFEKRYYSKKPGHLKKSLVVRISRKTLMIQKNVNNVEKTKTFDKFGGSRNFQ